MTKVPSLVIKVGSRAKEEMVLATKMTNWGKVMETSRPDQKRWALNLGELTGIATSHGNQTRVASMSIEVWRRSHTKVCNAWLQVDIYFYL